MKELLPVHPGEILLEEFMAPRKISIKALAEKTDISRELLVNIIKGKEPINEQVAIRLSEFFGNSVQFWLNLEAHFDVENRL